MAIQKQEFYYPSSTGEDSVFVRVWMPEGQPRALMQMIHGMCEHSARYDDFASFLAQNGILCFMSDMLGHGKTARDGRLGHIADENGLELLLEDAHTLRKQMQCRYDAPFFLFGHSMGSFLARAYCTRHGEGLSGVILSGTGGKRGALGVGLWLAKSEAKKRPATPSARLNKLAESGYLNRYEKVRTSKDWLTRDEGIVDAYIEDPLCGFLFTAESYHVLFSCVKEVTANTWAPKMPNVPVYLFSGALDPVGAFSKGVKQVERALLAQGKNVTTKIYPGARHEMINELDRSEVYSDVLSWLNGVMAH